ncbi:RICIN domain-containing protein [Sinomicrobium weinanense]|uniref:RICIN domain-containing protein n=1 Tax=Sinomicrobium weinanense TaxID=2842200 RepID=A0A926Q293_9FLAO|nr:RICIN domain-containing protein [Sinomicrobium weinanense]MBC9796417.1 RICIN domain-containing protein [Sinomicrobium weinanense]MBU3125909.1 RICIN domain-containing protein [Sinomicrobium weinanense]
MKTNLIAFAAAFVVAAATVSCSSEQIDLPGETEALAVSKKHKLSVGPPSAYGCFSIVNVASGKVLEVRGDDDLMSARANPKNVQQYTSFDMGTGTSQNQKWYLIQQDTGAITASTPFKIMNVANGLYLEAPDGNEGTQLFTDHANDFPSQIWYMHKVGNTNNYYIQNLNGFVLTNNDGSTADGAAITQASLVNKKSQYWNFSSITAEAYRDDQVVQFFRRSSGSIAFDQGSSIPLSYGANNGKVLWIGEDTYTSNIGTWDPVTETYPCYGGNQIQLFDIRNSALLQPSTTNWDPSQTSNITTNNSTYTYEILASPDPNDHGGTYTWPGVGVEIDNHVYMYAHEGGGSYNKTVIYDFTENTAGLDWGTAIRHTVTGLSDQTDIGYSLGFVKPGDGYVYPYGNLTDAFGGKYLHVARFATDTPFTWQFWDGTNWVATPSTASIAQLGLDGNTTKSLKANSSVTYVNGKYVLVEMDFGYLCPSDSEPHNIYVSTSTSPTGPFTARKKIYAIQDKINGALVNHYVVNAHPVFDNGRNELLVTYCINFTGCSDVSPCTNNRTDPYYYQLKAVRIPYTTAGI